jgi:hypothetical protein
VTTPTVPVRREPPGGLVRLTALAGLAVAVSVAAWLFVSQSWSDMTSHEGPSPAAVAAFEEKTGVQIVRVAVTGRGGIVDLRYRVIDADRSGIVHDPNELPAILDQETGEVIGDAFMSMWHHHEFPKAGVVYYQLFVNREGLIRPGKRVAVRLGGVTLKDVPVS